MIKKNLTTSVQNPQSIGKVKDKPIHIAKPLQRCTWQIECILSSLLFHSLVTVHKWQLSNNRNDNTEILL